jgi:type II secretory pathway pseudopilin PulG
LEHVDEPCAADDVHALELGVIEQVVGVTDARGLGKELAELLIVIAIIAILAAMLMPSLGKAKDKGKMAMCASNQRQLAVAAMTYTLDHNEWLNALQDVRPAPDGTPCETTYRVVNWRASTETDVVAAPAPQFFPCSPARSPLRCGRETESGNR